MNRHYGAIKEFYGDRRAERSGVLLMNHIDEGIAVLKHIGSSPMTIDAFCIHPMVQSDDDLLASMQPDSVFGGWGYSLDPRTVALAMEYRRVANSYLSHHCITGKETVDFGPLYPIKQMLLADKVQNLKDFERFHLGTHPNSTRLVMYFENWLRQLGVSEAQHEELRVVMANVTNKEPE